jgi:hypothetical protein
MHNPLKLICVKVRVKLDGLQPHITLRLNYNVKWRDGYQKSKDAVNETIVITVVHWITKVIQKKNKRKCLMTVKGLEKGCAKRSCWKQYGKAIKKILKWLI